MTHSKRACPARYGTIRDKYNVQTGSTGTYACEKLNRRLGLDREAWTTMVAASTRAEDDDPDCSAWH